MPALQNTKDRPSPNPLYLNQNHARMIIPGIVYVHVKRVNACMQNQSHLPTSPHLLTMLDPSNLISHYSISLPYLVPSLQRMRIHLHHGPGITLPSINAIIPHGEKRHTRRDDNRPIHLRRTLNLRRSRPKAEKDQQAQITTSHDIVHHTQRTLEPPRSPRQTAIVHFVSRGAERSVVVGIEIAAEPAPEE